MSSEQYLNSIPLGEMHTPLYQSLDRLGLRTEDFLGKTVVDIGGGLLRALGNQVFEETGTAVYTVEPRAESGGEQSLEAPLIAGEVQRIPLKSDSADLVVSTIAVPMWLTTKEDMQQAFAEIDRILKAGGEGRFYPPMHVIFFEELKAGEITLPDEVMNKSKGSQTSYATLIGLQNLGVKNLELHDRHVGDYEMIYHNEVLVMKKPETIKTERLPVIPDRFPNHAVNCVDTGGGEAFFSPLNGNVILT